MTKIYRDPDAYPHFSVGTLPFQAVILFGYYYIFSSLYSYAPAWRSAFSLCCVLIAFEILILSLLDATFLVARRYKTLLILSLSPLLTKLLPVLILVCIPYKSISSLLFSFALGSLAFICCDYLYSLRIRIFRQYSLTENCSDLCKHQFVISNF